MARTSRVLRTPTGFTLVELLVVITIIALLVALILPAVQSAREASRRSVCSANMRAVAQAVVTFESHRKQYPAVIDRNPAAATPNADGSTGYSWIFMVLPYMEQQQIFDAVSLGTSKLTAGPFSAAATSGATPVAAEGIPILGCPAYSEGKTTSGAAPGLALTNYKAMAGVFVTSVAPGIPGVSGTQSPTVVRAWSSSLPKGLARRRLGSAAVNHPLWTASPTRSSRLKPGNRGTPAGLTVQAAGWLP